MADTNHIDMGSFLIFDILPASITDLFSLTPKDGGYASAWMQNGALKGARLMDADNDGLINQRDGGNDPDDSRWDSDGDTLSDYFELQQGTPPLNPDADGDDLTDAQEIFYGTNPWLADTDGDRLDDEQELEGWSIAYTDSAGNRQTAWVWGDPLQANADGDGLDDFQEYLFGFNPAVAEDVDISQFLQFSEFSLNETAAPKYFFRFEESNGAATSFFDVANANQVATCQSGTCPANLVEGRYGYGLEFDGADDYLTIADSEAINLGDNHTQHTVAVWFKVDDASLATPQFIYEQGGTTRGLNIYVHNGSLYAGGWNDDADQSDWAGSFISTPINSDRWYHVALILDGTDSVQPNALSLYLDGVLIDTAPGSKLWRHSDDTGVGAVNNQSLLAGPTEINTTGNYFAGTIDELSIFNTALSTTDVETLMNGYYNYNDLVVKPGADLNYQVTMENTLGARTANGLVYAQPQFGWASVGEPLLALPFEDSAGATVFSDYGPEKYYVTCNSAANACPAAQADGIYGAALHFDGDDYLVVQNEQDFDFLGPFSVAAWIKVDQFDVAYQTVIAKGNSAWHLHRDGTSNRLKFVVNGLSPNANVTSNATFNDGQWHHIAVVYNASILRFYVDGQRDASRSVSGTPSTNDEQVAIGTKIGSTGQEFKGSIDEIAIFDHALSGDDVQTLANTMAKPFILNEAAQTFSLAYPNNTLTVSDTVQIHPDVIAGTYQFSTFSEGAVVAPEETETYISLPDPLWEFGFEEADFINDSISYVGVTDDNIKVLRQFESGNDYVNQFIMCGPNSDSDDFMGDTIVCPTNTSGIRGRAKWFSGNLGGGGRDALVFYEMRNETQNPDPYPYEGFSPFSNIAGSSFTLAAWIYPYNISSDMRVVFGYRANGGAHSSLQNDSFPSLFVRGTKVGLRYRAHSHTSILEAEGNLTAGNWHHIAFSYDINNDQTYTFYVNGIDAGSGSIGGGTPDVASMPTALVIGWGGRSDTDAAFKGKIDEVQIYDQALNDLQVNTLAEFGDSIIAQFEFDEIPGATNFEHTYTSADSVTCSANNCPQSGERGVINRAAYFDGNDKLEVDVANYYQDITLATWVKANGGNVLLRLFDASRNNDEYFILKQNEVSFKLYSACKKHSMTWTCINDPIDVNEALSFTGLPQDTWAHLAATLDYQPVDANNDVKYVITVYINGVEVANDTYTVDADQGGNSYARLCPFERL